MITQKIFYGVNGEGLGHISRTMAVIEHLPSTCEVHVFTYGKAYEYMQRQNYPHLHKIEGLMFSYKKGKVDYWSTAKAALLFALTNKNQKFVVKKANELKPSLFISDFEPTIPRVAHSLKWPVLSVDNQHRFAYSDLADLPTFLRVYGWGCGMFAKWIVPRPDQTIISTFHYDRIKPRFEGVTLTNGLLRKSVEEAVPSQGEFVLVYLRDSVCQKFIEVFKNTTDIKFKIYGANQTCSSQFRECDKFLFCELGPDFVKDLANCKCLVGTAGNQLISEARFLGKSIMAVPEPGQYEQSINAFYVGNLGLGLGMKLDKLTPKVVEDFVNEPEGATGRVPNGVHKVIEIIKNYLGAQ